MKSGKTNEHGHPVGAPATPPPPPHWTQTFSPLLIAVLGALGAAIAPAVQFVNGYWQNKLKETEIAHQIALDFAKLAITEKGSREFRVDTLNVISSIEGNPLQAWARTALLEKREQQDSVLLALRDRIVGRNYTTLAECKDHLEKQLKVLSYAVSETYQKKDLKDTIGAATKDEYTTTVERDCRVLQSGGSLLVAAAPDQAVLTATGKSKTTTSGQSSAGAAPVNTAGVVATTTAAAAPNDCAGGKEPKDLSAAVLAKIFTRARSTELETYVPLLREGLQRKGINTCRRMAMFLAQIGHESDELRVTQEFASGAAYEGRVDLGNTTAGDGARYKGRGLFLITGRLNYQRFAEDIGRPELMTNPDLIAKDPALALETALWYWDRRQLNSAADAGDLEQATRRINGGLNGLGDRKRLYDLAKVALRASG